MIYVIYYGLLVFEGVCVYNILDQGICVFCLQEYICCLFDLVKIYCMNILYIMDELNQVLIDIIVKNDLKFVYICLIVFFGDIGMGIKVFLDVEVEVLIVVFEWGVYLGEEVL